MVVKVVLDWIRLSNRAWPLVINAVGKPRAPEVQIEVEGGKLRKNGQEALVGIS